MEKLITHEAGVPLKYIYKIYVKYECDPVEYPYVQHDPMLCLAEKDSIQEVQKFVKEYLKAARNNKLNDFGGYIPKELFVEAELVLPKKRIEILAEIMI